MSEHAKDLLRRWRGQDRSLWLQHWDDLARVMLPRRLGFVTNVQPGEKRTDDIFDGTPMQAARGLANAIEGFVWPQGQQNFYIKGSDDGVENLDEAKDWFAEVERRMQSAMANPKARMLQARGEVNLDLAVFGTGIMFVGERQGLNGLLYQSLHLKDASVLFNEDGEPDGLFRCRTFTLRQAAARFGEERLSEAARKRLQDKKFDEQVRFLHAVLPRKEGRPDAKLAKNLPFESCWIEIDESHEVEQGGFHEFPFVVPRWDTSSGEDYGGSPGMIALPDSNTLQAMGETILVAGQRAADPPLLVPNDGFDQANTFPGGLSYYDAQLAKELGQVPIKALDTGASLPISRDMQQDVRQQVFAAFFRNVLNLPIDGPQMTAEEIRARKEEFIREIGPVFGRLESDYTGPKVERTFKIMLRGGALPPIPPSLQGRAIRFEYESPIKRIRQQVEAAAARLWVSERIDIAIKTERPEELDLVDFDEFARFEAEAAAVPHKILAGREAVEAKRRQRAEQMAQQAQMQMAAQAVDVAARAGDVPGVRKAIEGEAA